MRKTYQKPNIEWISFQISDSLLDNGKIGDMSAKDDISLEEPWSSNQALSDDGFTLTPEEPGT